MPYERKGSGYSQFSINDSLVNNIINVPTATGTGTTVVGIHAANLAGGDHTIKGNTVNGGVTGIYFGSTTTCQVATTLWIVIR
ncbi:MAG: hypothetical protein IPH89_00040 [Bacteroidetes bacterium]|nr:hypothetical protein [Bacteroidota bacterium]